ncbi:MAG: MXAN_6640 family putative metalloprotease [Nocardioides sp.]
MRCPTPFLPAVLPVLTGAIVCATLTLGLATTAAVATTERPQDQSAPRPSAVPFDEMGRALDRASEALRGSPIDQDNSGSTPDPVAWERGDATLALRDLFVSRRSLDEADEREAAELLARPTDGDSDPYRDGYVTKETKACSTNVCVHWVRTGADAPPSDAWAKKTLAMMQQVWRHHVGKLGYRKPAPDGSRGGNAKFDVYLKELGSRGLYGYCAPERRVRGQAKQAAGFCVLDDDFARSQFGRAPIDTLRVTAAHEFFHAIQFAYDFTEDPWLLESTATWVEERFADDVNDNRTYLKYGQGARATTPLDLFDGGGFAHYGNWVFWEFLSARYGNGIVRSVLQRTGTGGDLPDEYSTQALKKVLTAKGGLPRVYAAFAAANTQPRRSYVEGAAFPGVSAVRKFELGSQSSRADFSTRLNHLTAKTVTFAPSRLRSKKWRLTLRVDAPRQAAAPAVALLVLRSNGTLQRRTVELDPSGAGSKKVPFSSGKVRSVSVTMASASTRYRCDSGSGFACEGRPRDNRQPFAVSASASRR